MKLFTSIVVGCLVLSACAAPETLVKSGITYSKWEVDKSDCSTQAARALPPNKSQGAELALALVFGTYTNTDANVAARNAHYDSCMIRKNYQRMQLPLCKDRNTALANGAGPLNASRRITITSGTCMTTDNQGRGVIFTPS